MKVARRFTPNLEAGINVEAHKGKREEPLLFKGEDFSHTDVVSV